MASGHFQRCVRPQPGDRGDGDCELAGWIANLATIFETVWTVWNRLGIDRRKMPVELPKMEFYGRAEKVSGLAHA